jgi:hypothetical protein
MAQYALEIVVTRSLDGPTERRPFDVAEVAVGNRECQR